MSFITFFWIFWFLVVSSVVMFGLGILAAIGWCLMKAWAWFIAWRADRQLITEMQQRRGFKTAKRMGWLPRDLQ